MKTKKIKFIIALLFISFCQGLQFCISPVLDGIGAHYPQISTGLVQMLITAPALMSMAVSVLSGFLVVKASKKHLLVLGCAAAGLFGLLPLFYDSFWLLLCSRLLYGIGLGFATALSTAVIADNFSGPERTQVMGIQGACVGIGMLLSTTLGSALGTYGFRYAYLAHIGGLLAAVVAALCLPKSPKVQVTAQNRIRLNKRVYLLAGLMLLEMLFVISFSTNIAMHISAAGGSLLFSGIVTSVFSGIQILAGLLLGRLSKLAGKFVIPLAMLSFSFGMLALILFPSSLPMLVLGASLCGISQGFFIPAAMNEASGSVNPAATTMAVAALTVAGCVGQLLSPAILGTVSFWVFSASGTTETYIIAALGMVLAVLLAFFQCGRRGKTEVEGSLETASSPHPPI